MIHPERYSMHLYEDQGSSTRTTYAIRSFSGTVATFALGIAIGMAIPGSIANQLVNTMISTGLCMLVGDTLGISTTISLSADKYNLKYYENCKCKLDTCTVEIS